MGEAAGEGLVTGAVSRAVGDVALGKAGPWAVALPGPTSVPAGTGWQAASTTANTISHSGRVVVKLLSPVRRAVVTFPTLDGVFKPHQPVAPGQLLTFKVNHTFRGGPVPSSLA